MSYCAYIRKSRADREAELHGEGDTFARHEHILLDLARRKGIALTKIYRELVSGETIAARPVMQQLLSEVDAGLWDGVLVVEVERLARGDTSDQGLVQKSFTYSNTLIITPQKTYDPSNEFDAEYFEFGLFMSRREYKTINRRLQAGRISSVHEGKYPGNVSPYGYRREKLKNEKGWILTPDPDQAPIVKQIYAWFTAPKDRIRTATIANRLNEMRVPTAKGGEWTVATISSILKNPVYAGYIIWGRRSCVKHIEAGRVVKSRPWSDQYEMCRGRHEPLVTQEIFDIAQASFSELPNRPTPGKAQFLNPLAGLIVCDCCGRVMQRRPMRSGVPDLLLCPQPRCKTVSSPLHFIENLVLESLRDWLKDYEASLTPTHDSFSDEMNRARIRQQSLLSDLDKLNTQQNRTYTLLEQGLYSTAVFLERQQQIASEREALDQALKDTEANLTRLQTEQQGRASLIPRICHVLDAYPLANTAQEKNDLLTSVLEKVDYHKSTNLRHSTDSDLNLTIHPKFTYSRPY